MQQMRVPTSQSPCGSAATVGRRASPHLPQSAGLNNQHQQQVAIRAPRHHTVCSVTVTDKPVATATVTTIEAPTTTTIAPTDAQAELNQTIREGHYERSLVNLQASKADEGQARIASVLPPIDATTTCDVTVVGAGPAGLYLAAELGKRGLKVNVLGFDVPIVNNYGVWMDEFDSLGMSHTVECAWDDAVCYFGEGQEVRVGRRYGRVSRRKLREHLLKVCLEAGVHFTAAEVVDIQVLEDGATTQLRTKDGATYTSRLVTLAAGAAAGRFLTYEDDAPVVAAQTAYGIEAEVEGYNGAYPGDLMLFMDFRRHHTGLYDATAQCVQAGKHPNSGDGLWGSSEEAPSFLYAMPLGGKRVFLEETCLVAKPALPFSVLKRRLTRRLKAMGISVTQIHEEEWSYIPVGGPMPLPDSRVTAFGAAANMVHPATGFSVSRSFREATKVADKMLAAIDDQLPVAQATQQVWEELWPQERRTQATFHVFGMELLATLDLAAINQFFNTFFRLPPFLWRGFLASTLTSTQLLGFAFVTFVYAPWAIKYKLVEHMITDPAGMYLYRAYKAQWDENMASQRDQQLSTASAVAGVLLTSELMAQAVLTSLNNS